MSQHNVPARLIIGTRGSGKSNALEGALDQIAGQRDTYVLLIDPPGDLARRLFGRLTARGLGKHVFYQEGQWTSRKLTFPLISRPEATDPLERQNEITLLAGQMVDGMFARRGVRDGSDKPYTHLYAMEALRVYLTLPVHPLPNPSLLLKLFTGGPERTWMLANCADRNAAGVFEQALERSARSPKQWNDETGASYRLLKVLEEAAVWTCHGTSYDRQKCAEARGVELHGLQGLDRSVQRSLAIFIALNAIHTAVAYFTRTGKPLPTLIVLEEAGALNLVFPQLLDAVRQWRKAGVVVWVVGQSMLDWGEEIMEQMLGLMDEQQYFRLATGTERAAQAALTKRYDPKAVLDRRYRTEHTGLFEEIRTKTKGVSKDEATGAKRKNENEGVTFRPIFQTREDVTYKTADVQRNELAAELASLETGEYRLITAAGIAEGKAPLLPPPWSLGRTEKKTTEAIEELRKRPEYSNPTTTELPLWKPPAPTTEAKAKRKDDSEL